MKEASQRQYNLNTQIEGVRRVNIFYYGNNCFVFSICFLRRIQPILGECTLHTHPTNRDRLQIFSLTSRECLKHSLGKETNLFGC